MYRVTVEVLPGVIVDVLSTELLSFRGAAARQAGDTGAGPDRPARIRGLTGGQERAGLTEGASTGGGSIAAGNNPLLGAVGPAETAEVVRRMLTAAGLPEDLAAGQLLQRSLVLQSELRAANDRLGVLQKVPFNILERTACV